METARRKTLCVFLCVALVLSMSAFWACQARTHAHDFGTEWKTSATQHWKVCACGEKSEVGDHDYDDGTVTTEATPERDGVKTYTCKTCKAAKNESVKYVKPVIVLTEDTDFSALEGEKVTEAQWKAAFDKATYENVTIKADNRSKVFCWQADGELSALTGVAEDNRVEVQQWSRRIADDRFLTVFLDYESGEGYVGMLVDKNAVEDDEDWEIAVWATQYTVACPDFSQFFDSFTYDEQSKAYVLHDFIRTNSIFEFWDTYYGYALVKIVNGKLAFISEKSYTYDAEENKYEASGSSDILFYDFGTTEIEIPDYTPKMR